MISKKTASLNILIAESLLDRTRGMLFREDQFDNSVLLILNCNWVHSFFIKSKLYLYFVDSKFRLVEKEISLPSWSISPLVFNAKHVIESKNKLEENILNEILSEIKNIS